MGRLRAAVFVLGLPVALVAVVDRLGGSPLGLAAGVLVLLGALALAGAVSRRTRALRCRQLRR